MQDNPQPRRFPAPWTVVEGAETFVVVDAASRQLAFVYFDDAERGANSTRPLKSEALEVAQAIAAVPAMMRRETAGDPNPALRGPWTATDRSTWFRVDDASGRLVCAVYVDHAGAGSLTWDEARRLAVTFARLRDLLEVRKPPEEESGPSS
jgi:hypothetical protein